jgi:hypothetical protein
VELAERFQRGSTLRRSGHGVAAALAQPVASGREIRDVQEKLF